VRALLLVVVAGCATGIDPPWQLDHDRIVVVRATPPHIPSGATSELDALTARKGERTMQRAPESAVVISPPSFADTLTVSSGRWIVTAPSADRLAAARAQLKLAADAPVPLQIAVAFDGGTLRATKIVWLGDSADNPVLANLEINGAAPGTDIVVAPATDIPLSITANDAVDNVNWLSSCGTMHDFDLAKAHLRVEPADPQMGELGVVLRAAGGGVAWQVWPIHAQ
jgi:hypothetical protein